jgi:hypothetical protein
MLQCANSDTTTTATCGATVASTYGVISFYKNGASELTQQLVAGSVTLNTGVSSTSSSSSDTGKQVGLGVGLGVGIPALLLVIFIVYRHSKRQVSDRNPVKETELGATGSADKVVNVQQGNMPVSHDHA